MTHPRDAQAADLMSDFTRRTGLTSASASRRYLWTDAHALQNFLCFYLQSRETSHRDLAESLILAAMTPPRGRTIATSMRSC